MKAFSHTELISSVSKEVEMFCPKCGGPNVETAHFCARCGGALPALQQPTIQGAGTVAAPAVPGPGAGPVPGPLVPAPAVSAVTASPPRVPPRRTVTGKSPGVALVLSILLGGLGIGQFYNEDWKKGLVMLAVTLFLGFATAGLAPLAVWVWSAIDAYQVASGKWSPW